MKVRVISETRNKKSDLSQMDNEDLVFFIKDCTKKTNENKYLY